WLAPMSRLGLEPRTYGLTYRTGFRPPTSAVAVWTLSSPPARPGREPPVKSLRILPAGSFLLIAQSGGLSRSCCVPTALRVFQHMGRFYLGPLDPGTPFVKSVALPTELPALNSLHPRYHGAA